MMARENCSVSTYAYIDRPLSEAVRLLAEDGWKRIEIMCEGRHGELLAWPEERVEALKRTGEAYGIRWSIHAPITGCNPASADPETAAASEAVLLETLRLAERLGGGCVVLHAGSAEEEAEERSEETDASGEPVTGLFGLERQTGERQIGEGQTGERQTGERQIEEPQIGERQTGERQAKERIAAFLTRVLERTPDGKAVIALENVPPYPGLYGVEVSFLLEIADKVNSPRVGLVFDAGHAHMTGPGRCLFLLQQAMPRLVSLHLSDNRGQEDEHLGLGGGSVPIEAMVAWLSACRYSGDWVLELRRPEELLASAVRLHSLRGQFPDGYQGQVQRGYDEDLTFEFLLAPARPGDKAEE